MLSIFFYKNLDNIFCIMNKITDEYIKEYFFNKDNRLYTKKFLTFEKTHLPFEIFEYLNNRYTDSQSLKETIYRINYNYHIRPVCENCGKPIKFKGKLPNLWDKYCSKKCRYSKTRQNKIRKTCLEKYGTEYSWQADIVKNKIKQTCLEKYGVEFSQSSDKIKNKIKQTCLEKYGGNGPMSSKEIQEKAKQTCLKKYGVEFINQNKDIKNKIKQTCLEKYSVEVPSKSKIIQEKSKQTCLEKYGTEYGFQSEIIKEKIKETLRIHYDVDNPMHSQIIKNRLKENCLNKYGVEYTSQIPKVRIKLRNILSSKEVQNKIYNTKKKNNSFNVSKIEEQLYKDIFSIFPFVKRQYKEERYPFNCDFYIPELDMFIELNGFCTHGKHPFNPNSKEDQTILNEWKEKYNNGEHPLYLNMINVWTISDPKKRETAKKNNLNYVELFTKEDIQLFLINLQKIKDEEIN